MNLLHSDGNDSSELCLPSQKMLKYGRIVLKKIKCLIILWHRMLLITNELTSKNNPIQGR